ncbi:hypothetical protein HPC49_37205 [Pyxidicoccus fallax]|uniref:Uncharacterized protein n=1 Tax=Pyxidicoccus fallax TaxID=394095 RepID=A0A848LFC3_9BACT|nr:hypothetical protein [Pyxidicoccus fallax]NMO15011.1 hypothetical protein [Pyxidicoccus fallax]NPC83843.1 hypothetical protein [Pyxidicoccus fallax]
MAPHPSPEELMARLQAARETGDARQPSPARLQSLRELVRDCPALTPALLDLARLLPRADEPGVETEQSLGEAGKLLEQAVLVSRRSAPAVVELGYFLDVYRDSPEAEALFEEGARTALKTLEAAWTGLLRFWAYTRTKESLEKALRLARLAEQVFPESLNLLGEVETVRTYARQDGVPDSTVP